MHNYFHRAAAKIDIALIIHGRLYPSGFEFLFGEGMDQQY